MKKIKRRKRLIRVLSLISIVLVIIVIVLYLTLIKDKDSNNSIVGKWTTDGVTVYKFNKDNTGYLIVPLAKYKFNYKKDDNKLFIDFENKKSKDIEYNYSFKDDKLILSGENGEFIFKEDID